MAQFAMNGDQLLRSVIDRVAKANPMQAMEESVRVSKRAIRVLSKIHNLPTYSQIINMSH